MIRTILCALALACVTACTPALADTACDDQFLDGKRPVLTSPVEGADAGLIALCNDGYALLYDPNARILVYSAEHVTTAALDAGAGVERANSFTPDPRLKPEQSARPADYRGRPYDRGHMSPNHDMPTAEAKRQSDYLDNVVPQNRVLNRGLWSQIEARGVRGSIVGGLDGYVATGPILTPAPGQPGRQPAQRPHPRAAASLQGLIPPGRRQGPELRRGVSGPERGARPHGGVVARPAHPRVRPRSLPEPVGRGPRAGGSTGRGGEVAPTSGQ